MTEHCTRTEILAAARTGHFDRRAARTHIETCNECRQMWDAACAFAGAQTVRLSHAPSGWVERAVAISRPKRATERVAALLGHLVFDSWAEAAPAGLRGREGGETRRLTWASEDWSVELRAETTTLGWDVVAQVQHAGEAVPGAELTFDSNQPHTDATGMATWSGRRPPGKITLVTQAGTVQLEDIKWSRR